MRSIFVLGSTLLPIRRQLILCFAVVLVLPLPGRAWQTRSPSADLSRPEPAVAPQPESTPGKGSSVSMTRLLSPTALNVFNFGAHRFKVQYPNGTNFSGVYMTVTAVEISQIAFSQRVAQSSYPQATCLVYTGQTGSCIDYQVTCANAAGAPVTCPGTTDSYISFWTSFDTEDPIANPGLLTTPIGANSWQNVMDAFYLTREDPTTHGHTKGWSEFFAVALGATNPQGLGEFAFNAPLRTLDPKVFPVNSTIPVSFTLTSCLHCGQSVSDAVASISVLKVANAAGVAEPQFIFSKQNAFTYANGVYQFSLPTARDPAGTYVLTVYGDAFVSQQVYFTLQ